MVTDVYGNLSGFKMPRKSADKRLYIIYLPTRPLTPLDRGSTMQSATAKLRKQSIGAQFLSQKIGL